jgi:arabinofuranan 3-O-arabinosyltransferase
MTTKARDERLAGPAAPADAGEPGAISSRAPRLTVLRWSGLVWLGAFAVLLASHPGLMVFDTKLPVNLNPYGYYAGLWHLWNPLYLLGSLNNQAIGYAVPMAPFYLAGQLAHVPVWLTERLWMSLLIAVGFAGLVKLAGALGIGSPASRVLAGLMFALWPTFIIVIGSTSAAVLPGMLVPWAVLPLALAVRRGDGAVGAAARSGVAVLCMGGVNATVTLDVLILPGLFILTQARGRRLAALAACWAGAVLMATIWWSLPLLLQGKYAYNFLPYVEQAATTTATTSAAATLRGSGNWVAYLNIGTPWLPAGWIVVTTPIAIAASGVAAAAGLYGLASRTLPHGTWLRLSAGVAAAGVLAGYSGSLGGPFHQEVERLLNGPLAPFRNVYKLEPVIAVAMTLGLAHATAYWLADARGQARPSRQALTVAARGSAAIVLVGLALPYLSGQILNPGPFSAVPRYWYQVASFLAAHSPRNAALVIPGDAHGEYLWGDPIDDPLLALGTSPWAQRALVPYGGAGGQILLTTAETAFESGERVPGLAGYLQRAGIGYVVVRNDLNPGQIGYTPAAIVHQTLALSGFTRVTSFGPLITGAQIEPGATSQQQARVPSYPSVEVYVAAGSALAQGGRPALSPVQTLPASQTVLVDGGPDSLLPLTAQHLLGAGQPAIIAGDPQPAGTARWEVTDGQPRVDNQFGLINSNTSYTYTATETNPADEQLHGAGAQPRQLLPVPAAGHQTVSVLSGAASLAVSSFGSWLGNTQQDDPVGAFDRNPATAWAEGNALTPMGQWIQITFAHPVNVPARVGIRLLDDGQDREIATRLRVSTAAGRVTTAVAPTGATQQLNAVPGTTRWLRITITGAERVNLGKPGAGISDVLIPGVRVTRLLQPAQDPPAPGTVAAGQGAPAAFSFHQQVPSPLTGAGLAATPPMARTYAVTSAVTMRLQASALAVPGPGLDALLGPLLDQVSPPGPGVLQVGVTTTPGTLPAGFPASLVKGSGSTPWIADSASPVIHLSWHGKRRIASLIVAPAAGGSIPQTVKISSPDGTRTAGIAYGSLVTFQRPLTTDRIDVSFPDVQVATTVNQAGQLITLPVELSQLSVPALAQLRAVAPDGRTAVTLACGQGPVITSDGQAYQTSVSGTLGELTQYLPLRVRLCTAGGTLPLGAGRHTLTVAPLGAFAVTDLSLTNVASAGTAPAASAGVSRAVSIRGWQPDQRRLSVGPGPASYLEVHEDYDSGWAATLNGRTLTPVRLDGWQQGFVLPAGAGGAVTLTFRPAGSYHVFLVLSLLALVVLLAITVWSFTGRRRRREPGRAGPSGTWPAPPGTWPGQSGTWPTPSGAGGAVPARGGFWLGLLGATALIFVAGGLVALAVPVLACLSWLLSRWGSRARWLGPSAGVLPLLAFAGMTVSGLLSAARPAGTGLLGPFGGPAQVCALIALAAALTPAALPRRRDEAATPASQEPGPGPAPRRRLGAVDELSCYFNSAQEPNNVHLEVWLPGHLDESRLREAVAATLASQPATRVRLATRRPWRPGLAWEVSPHADRDPISVMNWRSEEELDAARARFLAAVPPLDQSPPFRLLRARGPEWESLILNAHHAAFDGRSCLLLLGLIADSYSGRDAGPPAAGREDAADTPGNERSRGPALRPAARIAPCRGRGQAPGYGFRLLGWPSVPVVPQQETGPRATINDLLVAALAETVRRWNARPRERHPGRRIRISMPIDDRPSGHDETLGNHSRLCTVTTEPAMSSRPDLIADVAAQTREAKNRPGPQVSPAMAAITKAPLPAGVKRLLVRLAVRCLGPLAADTSLLSNLGTVTSPPRFGPLTPTRMWFSTSAHMPRGLSVGAVTVAGRLQVCFRYRHALLDDAAADAFAEEYAAVLAYLTEAGP